MQPHIQSESSSPLWSGISTPPGKYVEANLCQMSPYGMNPTLSCFGYLPVPEMTWGETASAIIVNVNGTLKDHIHIEQHVKYERVHQQTWCDDAN